MIAAAQTLSERVATRPVDAHTDETAAVRSRLNRWVDRAAGGDRSLFEKRLAWDGWTPRDAVALARDAEADQAGTEATEADACPGWMTAVVNGLHQITTNPEPSHRARREEHPLLFEEILIGFVKSASAHLAEACAVLSAEGTPDASISPHALGDLERNLLRRLSDLCARALFAEFSIYRATSGSILASPRRPDDDDESYRSFVEHLRSGGLRNFFREYSVLARLVGNTVNQWVVNSAHLLERFVSDLPLLQPMLGEGPTTIASISAERSDPHAGGAAVHILTVESGQRMVYKPKPMGLCAAFQDLLRWVNQRAGADVPDLKLMTVLDRGDYGWVEFIDHEPCRSAAEVTMFFRRAGALMAIAYALNGEDLHHGNIIAAGEHPVLIDTEVLLCPSIDADFSPESGLDARSALTVMKTGMLPTWAPGNGADDSFTNLGGLFGLDARTVSATRWTNVNRDSMARATVRVNRKASNNLPVYRGTRQAASAHVDDVVDGFSAAYAFLATHREDVLAPDGPLSKLEGTSSRFLFRKTDTYGKTLRRLRHPKYLRSGIDRDIELEFLGRGFLHHPERPDYWPVVRSEREGLNRCDIPLFRVQTTEHRLYTGAGADLGECFLSSGMEVARAKLRTLDDSDKDLQCSLIRAAFYSVAVRGAHDTVAVRTDDDAPSADLGSLPPMSRDDAVQEACRLAETLVAARVVGRDGHPTWLALVRNAPSGRLRVTHTGTNIHDGRAGIALFFASLSAVLDKRGESARAATYADIATDCLTPVIETLQSQPAVAFGNLSRRIGGTVGVGSLVYGLTRTGALINDPDILNAASRAAGLLTSDVVESDDRFDVVSGAAGALLGMLALHRETGRDDARRRAESLAYHLLEHRVVDSASGLRGWPTTGGRLHTGFSHGASGIAHALLDLFRCTGIDSFREAALEAFAFEDALFQPDAGNWLPYPMATDDISPDIFRETWCHGAPGILMARAVHVHDIDDADLPYVEASLETTRKSLGGSIDHVCCGDAGRLLAIDEVGRALHRPEERRYAKRGATRLIRAAHRRGHYRLTTDPHPLPRPGLLQGGAGIGYALLRLTHPRIVPAVHLLR